MNRKSLLLILLALACLVVANILNNRFAKPLLVLSKEQTTITLNKDLLRIMSLGNRKLLSSVMWTQTLLQSDEEHTPRDQESWMYKRFNTISTLDPYFYENYAFGGIYLSIIKDDVYSAAKIYDKGLTFFPNDFQLLYHASFNYYFEIGSIEKAIPLYEQLLRNPKSKRITYLPSLVARLKSNVGNLESAFTLLYNSYLTLPEGAFKRKVSNSLYAIKAEIDLTCLNSSKKNCHTKDFEGMPYNFVDGKYQSHKKWIPFRAKKKRR